MGQLGCYSGFPVFTHLEIRFSLNKEADNVLVIIIQGLSKLNSAKDSIETSVAGHSGVISVERSFEAGIAEGLYFNYLDKHEVDRAYELASSLSSVDFLVYVNYRYLKEARFVNLLPDRYIVRFSLSPNSIKVFHLGGLRRTEPEDLAGIMTALINSAARLRGFEEDVIIVEDSRKTEKMV